MKAVFEDILRPEIILGFGVLSPELVVKEVDASAIFRKLTIKRLPSTAVAFQLDHSPTGFLKSRLKDAFKQLSCLIRSDHERANKKCDLVIIDGSDGKFRIILADLKSESPKKIDCLRQLKNSELYVDYILSLAREYGGVSIRPNYEKIIFYAVRSMYAKAPTQQKGAVPMLVVDDVKYIAIPLGGYKNQEGIIGYGSL